jgi:uncharacterized protein
VTSVWVERRKWPDLPHYRLEAIPLGEDDAGSWLGVPPDRTVFRGAEALFTTVGLGLLLVPYDQWWMAWFPSERRFSLYVDIVTPPERGDGVITMVDLDLDVIRTLAGDVELLDEDEFAEHQVSLGYPAEITARAAAEGARVLAAVRAGDAPFHSPPARWQDALASMS